MLKLLDAKENLYLTFQNYPFPKDMKGCSCCIKENEIKQFNLLSKIPKDQLTCVDFEWWYTDAMNTWGTAKEYLYFFPRIFELEMAGYNYCGRFCKSMQCLENLNWRETLSDKQINAIETFVIAYLVDQFGVTNNAPCLFNECLIWMPFFLSDQNLQLLKDHFFEYLKSKIESNYQEFPFSIFANFSSDSQFILCSESQETLMSLWPVSNIDFIHYSHMIAYENEQINNFIFDYDNVISTAVKKKWITHNFQMCQKLILDADNRIHEVEISQCIYQMPILIAQLC